MDTAIFWEIIGRYNSETIVIQILLFLLLAVSFVLSYTGKVKWLVKQVLGAIAKNSEQEDLKSDLKAATAALDKMLADISASMSEAVKVVKLTVPQHQWVEFR